MDRQQDSSGDYGYDLVHEAAGREASRPAPTVGEERPPLADDSRTAPDGDFGYDEAHDFRAR
jgi:hypothetical protein